MFMYKLKMWIPDEKFGPRNQEKTALQEDNYQKMRE